MNTELKTYNKPLPQASVPAVSTPREMTEVDFSRKHGWNEWDFLTYKTLVYVANIDQLWSAQDLQEADKPAHPKIEWLLERADQKSAAYINRRLEGYQIKEIAAMYNTTPGAINMHLQRLKKRLPKR